MPCVWSITREIVTAQHSMFLRGQTGCDVYVTCTASWQGHAPGPHASCWVFFAVMFGFFFAIVFFLIYIYIVCTMWYWTEKHLIIVFCFFFAYRKSSPLNYASVCSLLATSELLLSLSEHRVLMRRPALTRCKKRWKAGCQMRPSRADGVADPTSLADASEDLPSFLQKNKTKQNKHSTLRIWIHSESEELQLARTDDRMDLEVNPYQSADMRSPD